MGSVVKVRSVLKDQRKRNKQHRVNAAHPRLAGAALDGDFAGIMATLDEECRAGQQRQADAARTEWAGADNSNQRRSVYG
ncbi:hypothetical protein PR003_g15436 [Phytophthora rubi]|uniref:Uncharacterized protein n=2 Tax=Phytophthora TaxID=4783 RepID=A0A6A3P8V7_9STRA|nr:hypothetical protein PR001_g1427 [Phytophthora rubi]KAE9329952.1 hypothetical protein PR003_g15436 [Phytophthora rubi]KAE9348886.1 hypothetical protein PF008_g7132 [Phytophthora fragariae]